MTTLGRRAYLRTRYGSGVDVMERDWDHLLILDACRYDVSEDVVDLDGDLGHVVSRGSHSEEFCNANFAGRTFYDTVYVTANGHGARIGNGVFHDMVFTGNDPSEYERFDAIHPELNSLLPSTVHAAASEARIEYPDKRIIVHFVQPHQPYLGDRAKELRVRLEEEGVRVKTENPDGFRNGDGETMVTTLAQAAENGYITEEEFREVYIENPRTVLEYVSDLITEWDGKKVITADHGNLLGKDGIFGHPRGRYDVELRNVPWMVIESGRRPTITEDRPTESTAIDDRKLERQLELLGYKD